MCPISLRIVFPLKVSVTNGLFEWVKSSWLLKRRPKRQVCSCACAGTQKAKLWYCVFSVCCKTMLHDSIPSVNIQWNGLGKRKHIAYKGIQQLCCCSVEISPLGLCELLCKLTFPRYGKIPRFYPGNPGFVKFLISIKLILFNFYQYLYYINI